MAPYDVLVDPESIPEHPILQHDGNSNEVRDNEEEQENLVSINLSFYPNDIAITIFLTLVKCQSRKRNHNRFKL